MCSHILRENSKLSINLTTVKKSNLFPKIRVKNVVAKLTFSCNAEFFLLESSLLSQKFQLILKVMQAARRMFSNLNCWYKTSIKTSCCDFKVDRRMHLILHSTSLQCVLWRSNKNVYKKISKQKKTLQFIIRRISVQIPPTSRIKSLSRPMLSKKVGFSLFS